MLNALKTELNRTRTENGAATHLSTMSECLDLLATVGALRFRRAYAEDADLAMKILFFARVVRGGLGERRVFRVCLNELAKHRPGSVRQNITRIPEYGRWDDLLAKWLPSVNASNPAAVRDARRIAKALGLTDAEYRRTLVALRKRIRILENDLREKNYTFDYEKQPSKAMMKYRRAFLRNDGERYSAYLERVRRGEAVMHTGPLTPMGYMLDILGAQRYAEITA